MSKIVIAHAVEMRPDDIWYPYLRDELTARGHHVEIPALPDPFKPEAGPWLEALRAAAGDGEATVLVGHSLGAVDVLRLLQQHQGTPFRGVLLVAGMVHEVGYEALDHFFEPRFDWPAIRAAAHGFRTLVAADDPVLVPSPFEHAATLVSQLGAIARIEATGGHYPIWSPEIPAVLPALPQALDLVLELLSA
ncbi:RBBP9/YdeN family alpha/beta hydrolase [Catenulispora subtropica]|uniref:Alpha/beta hydrolase n=1 Tax=Catenulispora subtropica TaxID=450798 RepID=A0ABP5CK36_9ACTN